MAKHNKSRLSSALDLGVGAFAAASAGFVFFAMPEDLFSTLVVKSGLPKVLAAAQPPLGDTARLGIVAVVALVTFAFVWSLLRALDGVPARVAGVEAEGEPEPQGEVLRLRKADAHPDAPARRPLLAGRELGEPFAPEGEMLLTQADLAPEPVSVPEAEAEFGPPPAAEPEPEPEAEPEALPSFLVAQEPETEPDSESEDAEEAAPEPGDSADLSRLMARFESGLGHKRQAIVRAALAPAPGPQPEPAPAPSAEPAAPEEPADRVGHRLRSAITELQKVSGRAG
ncbi:MAG TPA: hypothetical protein VGD66_07460 [Allosphingosinicella sp.]|jgi:hypothetical protein